MAGLISDIVGGNVDGELEKLISKLSAVEKELDVINGKAITLKVDFQGVGSISELNALFKQQDEVLGKLRASATEYTDTYKMASAIIQQHNGHSKEFIAVSEGVAKTTAAEAKARKDNAKAILDEQKYIAALNKEKDALEKKTDKARIAAEKENNAYLQLRKTYNEQSTALKGMIIQYGEADAAVVKMKADVDKMYTSLVKAEQAVGQHQRKVGQYENATFALTQIIREAPSFAYGINVGIGALSNNLPILFDQFKRLRTEVGSTTAALKVMGASIFSFTNIFTLAYTALMLYTSGMLKFGSASDEMAKKMRELEQSAKQHAETEYASAQTLISIAQDVSQSYEIRVRAVKDLQDKYPDYLGHLSQEAILTGKTADEMERLNNALKNKALYQASMDKIAEYAKEYINLSDKLQDQQGELAKQTNKFNALNNQSTNQYAINARTRAALDKESAKRSIESIKKQIKETEDAMDKYQKLANQFASKAAPLIVGQHKDKAAGGSTKSVQDKINDDLAAAKSDYEIQMRLNQQKFVNSQRSVADEQALNKDNLKATMDYGEKYTMIVEDFNKRNLLSENEYIIQMNEANKILLDGIIKAKETGNKIEEEFLKQQYDANIELLKHIESLKAQRAELEKINREIDAMQDKAASKKEYAESFAPYLEGFGLNTSFGQAVKQKNLDIAKKQADLAALETQKPEAESDPFTYAIRLAKWETDKANERKSIRQLELEREDMYNQKMIEGKKELARRTVELAKTAFDAINTIRNNAFAAEQKQLEIQSQNLKLRTDQEMRAIDAKAGFEASKSNEKSKLAAETAAKENEIRARSNELSLRQARANKQAAQASIITNTAASIIKAFVDFPYPVAIPIAAALAATGAVQYAAASSAPLPQYAVGTEGTTSEKFVAGERGAELGITPSGKTMLFEKEGIYSAPLGTKIKTADQTKKLMQYAINGIGINGDSLNAMNGRMNISLDDKRIIDSIKEQTHDIATTLWRTKGNNNSSTQQAYIDAVREQQNLISKFK